MAVQVNRNINRKEDPMKFFVPARFEKSKDKESLESMRIRGYASTPDLDRDNEQVIQKGLDISDFVEYGFFNLDHQKDVIVGYPDKEKTKIVDGRFYVEGFILDTVTGRNLWDAAVALQKSKAPRRLGFSIEGDVLAKDSHGKILKAKVYNVAITATPVNPHATWEALIKSMSKSLSTNSGSALMTESLEHVMRAFQRALDGDEITLVSIRDWQEKLNKSRDKDDVALYLMLFKGLYGEDLEKKTNELVTILEREGVNEE